jgi:SAM-dependent methyltransferase
VRATTEDMQRRANDGVWSGGKQVATYASRDLRPVEVVILVRFRDELTGRILELGCGAGRLTGYICEIAASVHGIDLSAEMIAYCKKRYPAASFERGDLRDVTSYAPGAYEAVVAAFNVLDVLGEADRASILDGIHRTLSPGGLLVMSSHNRAIAKRLADPIRLRGMSAREALASLGRLPRWRWNRRRLVGFERIEPDYAILNDVGHDYGVLHYYIDRDAQQRQLEAHGFELLACLGLDGAMVEPGDPATHSPELHYVARRLA